MHGNIILEVEYQEVNNERYTQLFVEALKGRFHKELTEQQLELLTPAIEQSRLQGQAPVDLAQNLAENWSAIFD